MLGWSLDRRMLHSIPALVMDAGYSSSLAIRKQIEECFSWTKTVGGL
jgi:hypothetical protein